MVRLSFTMTNKLCSIPRLGCIVHSSLTVMQLQVYFDRIQSVICLTAWLPMPRVFQTAFDQAARCCRRRCSRARASSCTAIREPASQHRRSQEHTLRPWNDMIDKCIREASDARRPDILSATSSLLNSHTQRLERTQPH